MPHIHNINFSEHDIFRNAEININLTQTRSEENHFSLIIGENGTGKSELLKEIVEYFRIRKFGNKSPQIKGVQLELNPKITNDWPKKMIASSFSLNDKFPFMQREAKDDENAFYRYLGIRTASNNAFTGKIRDELFICMNKIFSNRNKLNKFIKIVGAFSLPTSYTFEFSQPRGFEDLFKSNNKITSNTLISTSKNIIEKLNTSRRFTPPALERVRDDLTFNRYVVNSIKKVYKGKDNNKNKKITFELDGIHSNALPESALETEFMLRSKLISIKEFSPSEGLKFQQMSSGQFHILKSIITLIAEIEDNSLILIDEPEISLHPSWQVNYMSVLNDMLSGYKGCHVFVATHSHLIVTSLPLKNSDVLVTRKRKVSREILIESLKGSPSGWSSDMILYGVFGVINANNKSFEFDIDHVASLMSNWVYSDDNIQSLEMAISRLTQYKLPDSDPLTVFIVKAEAFLKKVKKNEKL